MKKINSDIKSNTFERTYLIFGEESYLRSSYLSKLKSAIAGQGDSMNVNLFDGPGIDEASVIDICETLPFFSDRRLVILRNSLFFKNQTEKIADYIKEGLPDYLCLVFNEDEVDKRSRMFKAVNSAGYCAECKSPDDKTLIQWIVRSFMKSGKKIRVSEAEKLLARLGPDMWTLSGEIHKLIDYSDGRDEVNESDIEAIASSNPSDAIFKMIEHIASGKNEEALRLYYDLLTLNEPPIKIISLIGREYRLILEAKELTNSRERDIAGQIGVPPFALKKYASIGERFSRDALLQLIKKCREIDYEVKSGQISDRLGVELLIMR